jgi:AcrR family transcriptional regulator
MSATRSRLRKGRRELNKEDKLRRIKGAARTLFVTKGYDETSTREIAAAADVAQATLFLYAADKRDLLFLSVNDEMELVSFRASEVPKQDVPFLQNLIASLGVVYEFFGRERELARLVLREMMFYGTGEQGKRFLSTRQRMISTCCNIARMAQERGDISRNYHYSRIGEIAFGIYQVELRKWLAGRSAGLDEGLRRLGEALEVLTKGLSPRPRALELPDPGRKPQPKGTVGKGATQE